MTSINNLESLLDSMWNDYSAQNPQAKKIHDLFVSKGNQVINDHIALRTYNDKRVGIDVLSQSFLASDYVEKGEYHFEEKKLYAKHFEHPELTKPKVFISELKLEEFSDEFQGIVKDLVDQIPEGTTTKFDFANCGRPWSVSFETYEKLRQESEYGAWMAAFGFRSNHFTVSVNHLESPNTLQELNEMIKESGFKLNDSGGEIKGSPAVFLEQSSTLADHVDVNFTDGVQTIPACYYEFARRYVMPSGELYQGFVAKSADKIFESTNN